MARYQSLREGILTALDEYHRSAPLRRGMPREELKSRLKLPLRAFNLVLHSLAEAGDVLEATKWVSLPSHAVQFTPFQQVKVDKLLAQFAAAPMTPPSVKECQTQVGEEIYSALLDAERLVSVSPEVVFRGEDYRNMVAQVQQAIQQRGQVSLAEVRDLLGTSRKYVQALLEHLDALGLTVRSGDFRKLRSP
jgi:selenocysteine-specific elongation factor